MKTSGAPPTFQAAITRKTVFISHARPEDDELTRWLSGRLTARGYKVWADLDELHGGYPFWANIQRTIRSETARFLILVTRTSITRKGVMDELAEAGDVGRKLKDDRFIIPLKGDDLLWDEFPIQLKQLNGLDFSSDWSKGLSELLETLELSNVPRDAGDPEVARVASLLTSSRRQVKSQPEPAFLNWLRLAGLPAEINYFHTSLSAANLSAARGQISIPHAPHDRLILSFADLTSVRAAVPEHVEIESRYTVGLQEFLEGTPKRAPHMQKHEARNLLVEILRQGFDRSLRTRGLVQFDRRWFVPNHWRPRNEGRYLKPTGQEGYRVLVGKAKELTWHFSISPWVHATEPRRIQLTPHVLFSPDGATPLADQKTLRRRHCKLWWNDKWRDLLLALVAELFGKDSKSVSLSLGGDSVMTLFTEPLLVQLAASYSDEDAYVPDSEDEDAAWDDGTTDDSEVIA